MWLIHNFHFGSVSILYLSHIVIVQENYKSESPSYPIFLYFKELIFDLSYDPSIIIFLKTEDVLLQILIHQFRHIYHKKAYIKFIKNFIFHYKMYI